MKITFFLFTISAVFTANESENAVEIANGRQTKNATVIECKDCPVRTPPAITKWLELQNQMVEVQIVANQAAGFSTAFFVFLFMVIS